MSGNNRILYIDDNQDHLLIIKSMLKRDGYECDTKSRSQEGLEAALTGDYSLILVDIQMPQLNGIDLLDALKEKQRESGFRIVAITADSTIFSDRNPYELGFDAHISKPVMPRDLTRLVQRMLAAPTD